MQRSQDINAKNVMKDAFGFKMDDGLHIVLLVEYDLMQACGGREWKKD